MRFKAVPTMVAKVATAHPILVGGAVVLVGVGGYRYIASRNAPTDDQGYEADPNSSMLGYSYGMPMVIGSGGGGGGVVDSVSGAIGGIDSGMNNALLEFERVKEQNDFTLANKALDAQIALAATNAQIALAGIQATMYQVGAGLAQTFAMSGQQFMTGNIGDLTFAFLGTGTPITGKSKKSRKAAKQQFSNFMTLLNNATIQNIMGVSQNVQPSTGAQATGTYGSTDLAAPLQSSGGNSITSVVSGSSSGSGSASTYDTSTAQAAGNGTGGGGGAGGYGYNTVLQ